RAARASTSGPPVKAGTSVWATSGVAPTTTTSPAAWVPASVYFTMTGLPYFITAVDIVSPRVWSADQCRGVESHHRAPGVITPRGGPGRGDEPPPRPRRRH